MEELVEAYKETTEKCDKFEQKPQRRVEWFHCLKAVNLKIKTKKTVSRCSIPTHL